MGNPREAVLVDVLARMAEERGDEVLALDWAILDKLVEDKHEVAIDRAKTRMVKARQILNGKASLDKPGYRPLILSAVKRVERQAKLRVKRARRARKKDSERGFTSAAKPYGLRGRLTGVGLAQGRDGQYFVHTHRARSKSY